MMTIALTAWGLFCQSLESEGGISESEVEGCARLRLDGKGLLRRRSLLLGLLCCGHIGLQSTCRIAVLRTIGLQFVK